MRRGRQVGKGSGEAYKTEMGLAIKEVWTGVPPVRKLKAECPTNQKEKVGENGRQAEKDRVEKLSLTGNSRRMITSESMVCAYSSIYSQVQFWEFFVTATSGKTEYFAVTLFTTTAGAAGST